MHSTIQIVFDNRNKFNCILSTVTMRERRAVLLKEASVAGYNSVVVCNPENLFYTTGFWGEAVGVLHQDGATIIAPTLEVERATAESERCEVIKAERGSAMIPAVTQAVPAGTVCTDCRDHQTMLSLQKHLPNVVHDPAPLTNSRMIKDDAEIATLQTASLLIDDLFDVCVNTITTGYSEAKLQAVLMGQAAEMGLFDTGYPGTLNPLIVASGPNGALPHAQVTERQFQRGDMVVVDITLRYRGYVSDATRTFAVGSASDEAILIYDTVRDSQNAGLAATIPGAQCADVDGACRDVIEKAGHGKYFVHSTGHGVGLEVHEAPTISSASDMSLRAGMAITIEPGIYVPDRLGVRIEDSLMVSNMACPMHHFTKELIRV